MNRFAYNQLTEWKKSKGNSLLIVGGVPGVGKKDMVVKFAKEAFDNYAIFDLSDLDFDIKVHLNNIVDNSLVIIENIVGDKQKLIEIVELSEEYSNYRFIVIDPFAKESRGSDLSVRVSYFVLYPLGFEEFLFNVDHNLFEELAILKGADTISDELHSKLIDLFMDYLVVGGMPSVVQLYKEKGLDFIKIRLEQEKITNNIFNIFSSYYKTTEFKNLMNIMKNIFPTLIRENRKFKLADISLSKRYASFSRYFKILENLNLVHISRLSKGSSLEVEEKSLILYFFDTGLLGFLGNVPKQQYDRKQILSNQTTLGLCSNFAACELFSTTTKPIYFWNNNMSKVEFLLKENEYVLPVELKDDTSGKLKSLESFQRIYDSKVSTRLNLNKPGKKGNVKTYPLYLIKSLYRKFISLS